MDDYYIDEFGYSTDDYNYDAAGQANLAGLLNSGGGDPNTTAPGISDTSASEFGNANGKLSIDSSDDVIASMSALGFTSDMAQIYTSDISRGSINLGNSSKTTSTGNEPLTESETKGGFLNWLTQSLTGKDSDKTRAALLSTLIGPAISGIFGAGAKKRDDDRKNALLALETKKTDSTLQNEALKRQMDNNKIAGLLGTSAAIKPIGYQSVNPTAAQKLYTQPTKMN